MNRGDGRSVKHTWKLGHRAVGQHDHENKGVNISFIDTSDWLLSEFKQKK